MSLLASVNYDPATAVTKATTAGQALSAVDTTNLRLSFTVPATGNVMVRLQCTLHGSTSMPSILLGVLEGSGTIHRQAPRMHSIANAASSLISAEALFTISGLTPGATKNWDAAYGIETGVSSTGIKYGGPSNATANDAFGAFVFEVWGA